MITLAEVPVDIGRDDARREAWAELARPEYHADDPSLLQRGIEWLLEAFDQLLAAAGSVSPAGYLGLLVLVVLVVLAVVAIRLKIGRIGRNTAGAGALFDSRPLSADDHRKAADRHAARGEWAEAVRARLRAIVRGLEERDLLDNRSGRTAAEAATEAGAVLPACAAELRAAARTFDDVWYGGREATPAMDAQLRGVDETVARTRSDVLAR